MLYTEYNQHRVISENIFFVTQSQMKFSSNHETFHASLIIEKTHSDKADKNVAYFQSLRENLETENHWKYVC